MWIPNAGKIYRFVMKNSPNTMLGELLLKTIRCISKAIQTVEKIFQIAGKINTIVSLKNNFVSLFDTGFKMLTGK
jgi:hypothetical protein